jgi:glucose/arabinose dehydrogenase
MLARAAALSLALAGPAGASDAIRVEPLAGGLDRVTAIHAVAAAGPHLYVAEQPGRIRLVDAATGVVAAVPMLDIVDRVRAVAFEQGLTGLAFPPDFPADPRLFVHYTRADGASVIARFGLLAGDPARADPDSELVMLVVDQPHPTHNCNQLAFGPDAMLWIGCGDGGSGNGPILDPQWLGHLLGKVLRVDVANLAPGQPYRIPADNPYLADPSARPEIWANGLRNPYRFSFDPATDELWLTDVGQSRWEEVNVVPMASAPVNYGWPVMEAHQCWPAGTRCAVDGLHLPVHAYGHDGGRCAVIGGLRVRDAGQPVLDGAYLAADFCTGEVFALREGEPGGFVAAVAGRAAGHLPTVFARDADGRILLGTYGFGNGSVLRLVGVDALFADRFGDSRAAAQLPAGCGHRAALDGRPACGRDGRSAASR